MGLSFCLLSSKSHQIINHSHRNPLTQAILFQTSTRHNPLFPSESWSCTSASAVSAGCQICNWNLLDVAKLDVCRYTFICVPWRIHMYYMTYSCMWNGSSICLITRLHLRDVTPCSKCWTSEKIPTSRNWTNFYVWTDTFIRVAQHIYMWDATHSYMWHDSRFQVLHIETHPIMRLPQHDTFRLVWLIERISTCKAWCNAFISRNSFVCVSWPWL